MVAGRDIDFVRRRIYRKVVDAAETSLDETKVNAAVAIVAVDFGSRGPGKVARIVRDENKVETSLRPSGKGK